MIELIDYEKIVNRDEQLIIENKIIFKEKDIQNESITFNYVI